MLEVQNLNKTFVSGTFHKKEVHALREVSFLLKDGETLGILGKSGCGKTTLSRIIAGLLVPDSGEVRLDGKSILPLRGKERKQVCQRIQIVFQHPTSALDPSRKIVASLREPLIVQNICPSKEEQLKKIEQLMELTGLPSQLLGRYPHEISGGEAQRLVICRSLLLNPQVLILDEPTSMLDVSIQASIMTLLRELQEKLSISYLFISHDLDLLAWLSDQIAVMKDGAFLEYGPSDQILHAPRAPYTQELIRAFS
ncbi:MAG: ABC transporter ATP-binding protein [Candidatus Limivivens sp.]|nr:ABC transporter ATP-binding protein [Candidatus Limivivens sp.]